MDDELDDRGSGPELVDAFEETQVLDLASELEVRAGYATDVGRKRERNEDSYALFAPAPEESNPSGLLALLAVTDGMGGQAAGDRAGRMAAEQVHRWFATGEYRSWPEYRDPSAGGRLAECLRRAVREASEAIYRLGEDEPAVRGAGSTLVMALLTADRVHVAHVGDSRCYRLRRGRFERLTRDHSWVERQVAAGVLSPEEARCHPQRNILIRSLGDAEPPVPDLFTDQLHAGDVYVLCSDGLTGGVDDSAIFALAARHTEPQELAEALVRLANQRDGSDNITVVVGSCHRRGEAPARGHRSEAASAPTGADAARSEERAGGSGLLSALSGVVARWFGRRRSREE